MIRVKLSVYSGEFARKFKGGTTADTLCGTRSAPSGKSFISAPIGPTLDTARSVSAALNVENCALPNCLSTSLECGAEMLARSRPGPPPPRPLGESFLVVAVMIGATLCAVILYLITTGLWLFVHQVLQQQ